ncbi:MAG: TAXI family TRAP transporter solute-binding subunit [Pseudomonadota bacterium]
MRRQWKIWGPSVLVVLIGFLIAYQFVEPAPPRSLVMGTGSESGAYHAFGERYRVILAQNDIDLILKPSSGTVENLASLQAEDDGVDVAFVQGGVAAQASKEGLEALASLYLEPLWIFVTIEKAPRWLSDLRGERIAVGRDGSGTRVVARQLLRANMIDDDNTELADIGGQNAYDALKRGDVDALFMVASANADLLQTLLQDPDVRLMSIERADAYVQNYRYLKTVKLAQGAANLGLNQPDRDITMLAPVASLVAKEDLHPALGELLMLAATTVHRQGDLFAARGEFPSDSYLEFPLDEHARRYLDRGPPLLQRHLPFWLATFVERTAILLIPLLTLLIPLIRILPPVLDWRTRRRVYRWYDELNALESASKTTDDPGERRALRNRLEEIEHKLMTLSVPRHRTDLVINLRAHVKLLKDALTG